MILSQFFEKKGILALLKKAYSSVVVHLTMYALNMHSSQNLIGVLLSDINQVTLHVSLKENGL